MNTMNMRILLPTVLTISLMLFEACTPSEQGGEAGLPEVSTPVRVEEMALTDFNITYNSIGSVTSDNRVNLLFEASGKVTDIYVQVGEEVDAGDRLASIKSDIYETAFLQANSAYDKAVSDLESAEKLFASNVISSDQLNMARLGVDNARAGFTQARNMLENTVLRAPFSGHIVTRNLNVGDLVSPAGAMMPPFVLADMNQLKVVIPVPEARVGSIREGQLAELEFKSFPGKTFAGRVQRIGMAPKDMSNNFDVEIFIEDDDHELRLGLVADVHVVLKSYVAATVVPLKLVQDDGAATFIYTAVHGRAKRIPVDVIALNGEDALIKAELTAGDTLIVRGHKDVREGSLLDIFTQAGA